MLHGLLQNAAEEFGSPGHAWSDAVRLPALACQHLRRPLLASLACLMPFAWTCALCRLVWECQSLQFDTVMIGPMSSTAAVTGKI